ncbi:MAG: MMPL family transporter [Deltaproteobacteria bacterium]|nr:MMPL family transporter [Deltaproteobacteria bacterium]
MIDLRETTLHPVFRFVIAKRWWVLAAYALLLAASIPYAVKVEQDNAFDRLIVRTDPDYIATREFSKVFGGGEYVVLFAEADDPFSADVIGTVDALDRRLQAVPKVGSNSIFSIYRRARPGADPTTDPDAFKKFATGTKLFARQGLVGPGFYSVPLIFDVRSTSEREQVLRAIDAAAADVLKGSTALKALRRAGEPYVNDYMNRKSNEGGMRLVPVFCLFVVALVMGLYRSLRTLAAFAVSLGVNAALAVGWIGLTGGTFTIVSALVPMTILITCLATLVYIHSRFVERPPETGVDEHQVFALANKFLACTASVFATAVGFAALAVSDIRPIREMGIWVAVGLVFTWLVAFTLFPALQKILRTPTQIERKTAAQWFLRVVDWMPRFSYRWRWVTVPASLLLCGIGAVSLFGFPGLLAPMKMLTHPTDYMPVDSDLYRDTRRVEQLVPGLSMADVWLRGKVGSLNQPEVIKGLDAFQRAIDAEPLVGSAVGPTTVLRMFRYVGGKGDVIPDDPGELEALTDNLEALLSQEPLLARFVDPKNMAQTHITLVTRINDFPSYEGLGRKMAALWSDTAAKHPALAKEFGNEPPRIVGIGRLQTKVAHNLVPTLTESFALSVVIIFSVFLIIFRNGAARLMAMIPSLFAILVMFAVMRATGMSLNVATILIASTVLGTSENDQIHFFYHFLERQKDGTTETGLRHTMLIAGRSIFFATLINSIGFLAFALSDLPPIRQFAILAAVAFVLSMIADFTALPGALWMVFRDRPDALKKQAQEVDTMK